MGDHNDTKQLWSFITFSPGENMLFSYARNKRIEEFTTDVTSNELPFSHDENPNLEHT